MKSKQIQVRQKEPGARKAAALLGEASGLLEQLGAPDPFASLDELRLSLKSEEIDNLPRLEAFLQAYQSKVLSRVEFPFIIRACGHAVRGEARELIALDKELGAIPQLATLAAASRRIGRSQLERLRPLRDHRVAKRYLSAADTDEVQGWHPLVFGLTIAVYSLPHRQALLHYGEATLSGLAGAAAAARKISVSQLNKVLEPMILSLPASIEAVLPLLMEAQR